MILAFNMSSARRLATVGLVATLFAGCSVPTVAPTPAPPKGPTMAPTMPPYTLGPSASAGACPTTAPAPLTGTATVTMTTNFGNIVIKVDSALGANAAGSFVALARCGYYNNVIFHRVLVGYFIQAGDGTYGRLPDVTLGSELGAGGPNWSVPDDAVTTPYKRGTLAMANSGPGTGASQFFIILSDTAFPAGTTGYAIFGNVTTGMDVADRIGNVPCGGEPDSAAGGAPTRPLEPIVITSTIVTTP